MFVRWYGSVLQGEVVENQEKGILSGMIAVRILVQGAKATALFAPEHVYASVEDIKGNSPQISANCSKTEQKPREIPRNEGFESCQKRINDALLKADPLDFIKVEAPESVMNVLRFKEDLGEPLYHVFARGKYIDIQDELTAIAKKAGVEMSDKRIVGMPLFSSNGGK